MSTVKSPKKLIEVALPLDAINAEAAREKSIRHGHPSTLHLWWARRPLAAARAVIFAQMVNDPGGQRGWVTGVTKKQAAEKREKLFDIIKDLVKWENTNNEEVLERAREAIRQSWRETCELNKGKPGFDPEHLPAFHDPFAGGGAIPLEAQRLGLESYASDLNPVAVMINKAMIEIPPKFAGREPVGPLPDDETPLPNAQVWPGATGLAEDVRRYGYWMREEAKKRIGHLYPEVEITRDMVRTRPDLKAYEGKKLTVIAWLWARTVKSPNPQFSQVDVPLVSSFVLSKKKGHEAYVQPIIEGDSYRFEVKVGIPPREAENGTTLGKRNAFYCLMSHVPVDYDYIRDYGKQEKLGVVPLAIVAEGARGRIYLSPNEDMIQIARGTIPQWKPTALLPDNPRDFKTPNYGMTTFGDLFTPRQLVALNTFSDLVQEARKKAIADAKVAGMPDDGVRLAAGGTGATAYGDALAVYLTFGVSRITHYWSNISSWHNGGEKMQCVFARQAIPMTWDYAECNPYSSSSGNWQGNIEWIVKAIEGFTSTNKGEALQADAQTQNISSGKVISTDPPYYDNIGYADLSDFFYVWMRRGLRNTFPDLFATMAVPKAEELVATPYRHGSKEKAETFFLDGMTAAMHSLAEQAHPGFPVTIYYAFKASDTDDAGTSNTGWETFLAAVLQAGFAITGTWPMRTEMKARAIERSGTNALASSIVLVCRKRDADASEIGRKEFLTELRETMPDALSDMIGREGASSPIAPVDLAQAAIGPGMEIFSKYKAVLNADGSPMTVHEAMIEINRQITEFLNPDGSGFDAATLFCNDWFQQYGWNAGPFGTADTLARAKGTSVAGVKDAGVITAEGGKVQLLNWRDYPEGYEPAKDRNRPAWEACHYLIRELNLHGEEAAGKMLSEMPEAGENIRQLAYFLYTLCERKGNAEDARYYNELMTSWYEIVRASEENRKNKPEQMELL